MVWPVRLVCGVASETSEWFGEKGKEGTLEDNYQERVGVVCGEFL